MKKKLTPFVENFAEAGTACLLTMVQGNVLVLGLGHWLVASQTGLFAGGAATVALIAIRRANRWVVAGVLAVVTATVDYLVHPGSFGGVIAEAAVTGLAAGALSLLVTTLRRRVGQRRVTKAT